MLHLETWCHNLLSKVLLQQGSLDVIDHKPNGPESRDSVVVVVGRGSLQGLSESYSPVLNSTMQCSVALPGVEGSWVSMKIFIFMDE